jgi:hypothetical protein
MQLNVGRDVILCLIVIGRVEPTQEWAIHGHLDRAPDYRDTMHVNTFAVAGQGRAICRLDGLLVGDVRKVVSCC